MNPNQPAFDVDTLIARLRERLAGGADPPTQFTPLMDAFSGSEEELSFEALADYLFLAERAIAGVDIETNYPDLFSQLISNPAAQRVFSDALEHHHYDFERPEETPAGQLGQQLLLSFKIGIEVIQSAFKPQQGQLAPTFRGEFIPGDELRPIHSGRQMVAGMDLKVDMAVRVSDRLADAFDVQIRILAESTNELAEDLRFQAHLAWGDFEDRLTFGGGYHQGFFAPVPVTAVEGSADGTWRGPLQVDISLI